MFLRNSGFFEMAQRVKENNNQIIIYGAGMIGRIVMPYIIEKYALQEYIECFVDMDGDKIGQRIKAGDSQYEIRNLKDLKQRRDKLVLLITNSKFYSVVDYLDGICELDNAEAYIIPMMQILEQKLRKPVSIKRITKMPLIPKKIHYCWFGEGQMPEFLLDCIETWKKNCPDYEIIEWNERNYDISSISYSREAYENHRYGFVTDVVRLDILYQYGGIYMDTDVTMLKNLDELLYQPCFVGVEKWGNINTGGGIGAVAGHPMIKEMLDYRKQFSFIKADGSLNIETNGWYETIPFIKYGMKIDNSLQVINDVTIYPSSVFHPYDYVSCEEQIEEWTFLKHHFYGGWMEQMDIEERSRTQENYRKILKRME